MAQPVAPTAIPLPRFAAPPGLRAVACEPPRTAADKLSEACTPETQSPRSSAESSSSPSPRRAEEQPIAVKKGITANRTTVQKHHLVAPLPGLDDDAVAEFPSLVQVFAELRQKQVDPDCLLKLRKVQPLGARAPEALERYFGRMPGFQRVIVVYSHTKSSNRDRVKLSGLAFVLFASRDCACLALAKGSEQSVDGATVAVGRYESGDAGQPLPRAKPSTEKPVQIVEGAIFAL